jgi:hypothetical protein
VRKQICIGSNELGKRALQAANATHHAIHFIAGAEGSYTGPNSLNGSRHIKTEHRRQRLPGMWRFACTNFGINRIDATGRDPDQDLILSERRTWNVHLTKFSAHSFNKVRLHDHSSLRDLASLIDIRYESPLERFRERGPILLVMQQRRWV